MSSDKVSRKILFDLSAPTYAMTDHAQYSLGLARALREAKETQFDLRFAPWFLGCRTSKAGWKNLADAGFPFSFGTRLRSLGAHLCHRRGLLTEKRWIGGLDLVHSNTFIVPPVMPGVKRVGTLYDLSFMDLPEDHSEANRLACLNFAMEASSLDAVVTLSRHARRRILDLLPVTEDRIHIVAPAPRKLFSQRPDAAKVRRVLSRLELTSPYLLFLGTLEPQSNLVGLLDVFEDLQGSLGATQLVMAGKLDSKFNTLKQRIENSPRVRSLGVVADEDLPSLLRGATAFVFPSRDEGFGMPVIEAMAAGTAVVSSDRSSLKEICSDAALTFDPEQPREFAEALRAICTRPELRQELIEKGSCRAGTFQWARSAEQLLKVYEEVLPGENPGRSPRAPTKASITVRPAPLRILVNLLALQPGVIGGMGDYALRLIERFEEDPRVHPIAVAPRAIQETLVPLLSSGEQFVPLDESLFDFELLPGLLPRKGAFLLRRLTERATRWKDRQRLGPLLQRVEHDLYFGALMSLDPDPRKHPCVVTLPDLQHLEYPEFFSPEERSARHRHWHSSATRADRVITISQFSARQINHHLGIPAEKVLTIPLAPTLRTVTASVAGFVRPMPEAFFLYPANPWPHKNHRLLLLAFRRYRQLGGSIDLVLTGAGLPESFVPELIRQFEIESLVHVPGYVSRSQLAWLYEHARALVFPSLFEGYGLPLADAMLRGCPVACSDRGSLPEVGGNQSRYFDPRNPEEMAKELLSLERTPPERATGFPRDWTDVANEHIELFLELASRREDR